MARPVESPPPRFIVCLDTPDPAQVAAPTLSFRELLTRHQGIPFELPFPSPDNLATLIFTSGTTGEPRGVAYTHAQLVHAVRSIARAYRQLPNERWRLNKKAGRFFLRPLVPVLDGVAARRVRQSLGGKLAFLVSGSAPLNEATFRFFSGLGVPILEAYGTSENAIPIALNRPDAFCPGTVGRPLAPNDVRLSEDGEVLVKGPCVFSGYWNRPQDPALFQGAYLRTGDEGHWVGAGFLKLTGRRSDIIKTSTGRRLAPGPLEEKFKEIPFVDQAVIVGNGRKGPVLILSLKEGISAKEGARRVSDVLKEKARLLPLLSQPVGILVLNRPFSIHQGELTANMKLRRRAIESSFAAVLDKLCASAESPSPAGPVIWAAGPGGGQGGS